MRIRLSEDDCVGHGRCYALAPEVFDADDRGHCVVKVAGELSAPQEGSARLGVANCPEDALLLEE